jgi:hypothetical protein
MARDYDSQLLESVSVRRGRLRGALLYGSARGRRSADVGVRRLVVGLAVAAVVCAGCVGWSFVAGKLHHSGSSAGPTAPSVPPAPYASSPPPRSSAPSSTSAVGDR